MKILHIAPHNYAGMPLEFVKMHRINGNESHLVTLYRNTLNFEEDICLNLPISTNKSSYKWRDSKIVPETGKLKYYEPKNFLESVYFRLRDFKNKSKIESCIKEYNLKSYDVIHFDGGMDFYRDVRFAAKLKESGKKIVCCYFGSDLRTRGVFRKLDELSDLNLTVEFDHIQNHQDINYIFSPFDTEKYKFNIAGNKRLKIIHSPTNRLFKGTDKILPVIEEVKKVIDIDFILAENMARNELLKIKSGCDLAIDQVAGQLGGSGYGKNSIENLAMGIPTITEFTPEYLNFIEENPFIHTTIDDLKTKIIGINNNRELLKALAVSGRQWVEKFHSYSSVNEKLNNLYRKYSISG